MIYVKMPDGKEYSRAKTSLGMLQMPYPLDYIGEAFSQMFDEKYLMNRKLQGPAPQVKKADPREFPCSNCEEGELLPAWFTQPNGQTKYECDHCGHQISLP